MKLLESAENAISALFMPKKAISYLRVSTPKQARRGGGDDEGYSLPAQREANRKKAASMGAIIVKEFIDRGTSARSVDRKDLQEMLKYIEETPVDYCIVHKVDRMIRNRWDDADISRTLVKHGVKLVSTMESIDETPAGKLMHGILASIAEFYSNNLATEVLKGMTTKVEMGGTISKAPLGYLNKTRFDEQGREERYVTEDDERFSLMSYGFDEMATGEWASVDNLADYLASRGLTTRATPKVPSQPITGRALHKAFRNPYYKGLVLFKGKYYPGKHPKATSEETWDRVQDILDSHQNGERIRKHPHFLKSTVFCGTCRERLLVQNARSRSGMYYPYFSCAGRHAKRSDCMMKSLLIDEIERQVEMLYLHISFKPEYRKKLEIFILDEIRKATSNVEIERRELEKEKEKLERRQRKLLEAHYDDAIPKELFKEEQRKVADAIRAIDKQIQLLVENSGELETKLSETLELLEDCGALYINAPNHIKRMLNQAIFEKIYVYDGGSAITVVPEFTESYALLFGGKLTETGAAGGAEASTEEIKAASNGFMGWRQAIGSLKTFLQNQNHALSKFFGHGFSNNLLVGHLGFEPRTDRL